MNLPRKKGQRLTRHQQIPNSTSFEGRTAARISLISLVKAVVPRSRALYEPLGGDERTRPIQVRSLTMYRHEPGALRVNGIGMLGLVL